MIEIKELKPDQLAITPRGHKIMVLEQGQKTTLVRVVSYDEILSKKKGFSIPNSQLVTPISSR